MPQNESHHFADGPPSPAAFAALNQRKTDPAGKAPSPYSAIIRPLIDPGPETTQELDSAMVDLILKKIGHTLVTNQEAKVTLMPHERWGTTLLSARLLHDLKRTSPSITYRKASSVDVAAVINDMLITNVPETVTWPAGNLTLSKPKSKTSFERFAMRLGPSEERGDAIRAAHRLAEVAWPSSTQYANFVVGGLWHLRLPDNARSQLVETFRQFVPVGTPLTFGSPTVLPNDAYWLIDV